MQLSLLLLLCLVVLCCTGNLDRSAKRLTLRPGSVAAVAVLLALLSAFEWEPFSGITLLPAGLLLLGFSIWAARCAADAYTVPLAAFLTGLLSFLLAGAFPDALEPGLLVALPAALLARLFYRNERNARAGLLLTLLSPLFYALFVTLSDWYLFGFVRLTLYDAVQFDAAVSGACLYALFCRIPAPAHKKHVLVQKDA